VTVSTSAIAGEPYGKGGGVNRRLAIG
jgi:hypothetical protein